MTQHDDLLQLERAGWEALSSSGDAAATFYAEILANEVLMVLPGGNVIDDRAVAIDSMSGTPWTSFELRDERVLELTEASAVVVYRSSARRGKGDYEALFNSTYVP